MEKWRIVFSGSGGQGVITAAIILGEAAALYENLNAVQSQVYGPEARGGASRSDLIISTSKINFPKVIQPNILLCFTRQAYYKYYPIIRPGGLLITDTHFVTIEKRVDARQVQLAVYDMVMDRINNAIVFNIAMLGALLGITDLIGIKSVVKVLKKRIPAPFFNMNLDALHLGVEMGLPYKR